MSKGYLRVPITVSRHKTYRNGDDMGLYIRVQSTEFIKDSTKQQTTQYIGVYKNKVVVTVNCPVKLPSLPILKRRASRIVWLGEIKCYPKNEGLIYYLPKTMMMGVPGKTYAMLRSIPGKPPETSLYLLEMELPNGDTSASD